MSRAGGGAAGPARVWWAARRPRAERGGTLTKNKTHTHTHIRAGEDSADGNGGRALDQQGVRARGAQRAPEARRPQNEPETETKRADTRHTRGDDGAGGAPLGFPKLK